VDAAEYLVAEQAQVGPQTGGLIHPEPCPHTYSVDPPWLSGIAQGEAASFLVRIAAATSDDRFAEAARLALQPMRVPTEQGGVGAKLDGGFFPEEYPTNPRSFVLNGAIFALWGCHDVAVGLDDDDARELYEAALETLARNLDRYDLGYWSRYDLYPHRVVNVASPAYHRLHIDLLRATAMLSGRQEFEQLAQRFESYAASRWCTSRAFARKVIFRLAVPRRGLAKQSLPSLEAADVAGPPQSV
jgi:hypothetical protein